MNLVVKQVDLNISIQFQYNDKMDVHQLGPQQSDRINKPKNSTKQLQLHVASVYSQIADMIKQKGDLQIQMPSEVPTAVQRVNLIKSVLAYLLDQPTMNNNGNQRARQNYENDDQDGIQCAQCENYQKNLQKLEGEVRNHIRTYQQLKIYQDGLEQKIQQYKKQKKQFQKKYDSIKKKYQEVKQTLNGSSDKMNKIQQQNEKLRSQLKLLKQKVEQPRKGLNRYESNKENLGEWKNSNVIEKERQSIEKRPQSTQRLRISVNARSTKGIPISSKIIQQKNKQAKEEKVKALKNRLGF